MSVSVDITTLDGQYLVDTKDVVATVSAPSGINTVVFKIDGAVISTQGGGGQTAKTFTASIDSAAYINGDHILMVTATDLLLSTTTDMITLTFANLYNAPQTGDRARRLGQFRECVYCGWWFPERDSRIMMINGKWVCKWDVDTLTDADRRENLNNINNSR